MSTLTHFFTALHLIFTLNDFLDPDLEILKCGKNGKYSFTKPGLIQMPRLRDLQMRPIVQITELKSKVRLANVYNLIPLTHVYSSHLSIPGKTLPMAYVTLSSSTHLSHLQVALAHFGYTQLSISCNRENSQHGNQGGYVTVTNQIINSSFRWESARARARRISDRARQIFTPTSVASNKIQVKRAFD